MLVGLLSMLDIGMSGLVLRMAYKEFQSMHYAARAQFIERSHLIFTRMHTFTRSIQPSKYLLPSYQYSTPLLHISPSYRRSLCLFPLLI
jgi:hypothetical protein